MSKPMEEALAVLEMDLVLDWNKRACLNIVRFSAALPNTDLNEGRNIVVSLYYMD
jgi:hypothetical protein